jgi:hypothetical protein
VAMIQLIRTSDFTKNLARPTEFIKLVEIDPTKLLFIFNDTERGWLKIKCDQYHRINGFENLNHIIFDQYGEIIQGYLSFLEEYRLCIVKFVYVPDIRYRNITVILNFDLVPF